MEARTTRRIASVGSRIQGSGTLSTRTSRAPYITVARISDLLSSGRGRAYCASLTWSPQATRLPLVVGLLHRDVRHEPRRGGAVPVLLARLEEDAVSGPDHLDRAAAPLAEADAFGDPDRLAVWVRVPGGAGARREVDARPRRPRSFDGAAIVSM